VPLAATDGELSLGSKKPWRGIRALNPIIAGLIKQKADQYWNDVQGCRRACRQNQTTGTNNWACHIAGIGAEFEPLNGPSNFR